MKISNIFALTAAGLGAVCHVSYASMANTYPSITKAPFGKTPDGTPVEIYTLRNARGAEARIMTCGGIVQSLRMPDRRGHFADIVLGFPTLEGYVNQNYVANCPYFGALIGRYANRIANGEFKLDGHTHQLPKNDGPNCLHGGLAGFDKVLWTAKPMDTSDGPALILTYLSRDGEQGFPGNLMVAAVYTLMNDDALKIEFTATTDKPTVVSLTHHSYWNLKGQGDGSILDEVAYINADKFTPINSNAIPTGEERLVKGTPFDFTTPHPIGEFINDTNNEQIRFARGYDDNFVLNKPAPGALSLAASVCDPSSGRTMEVYTTAPGMQFYTGNFLDGTFVGKDGKVYKHRYAFAMEPQEFPDAPNHPNFPSAELQPGQTYHNTIIYKFGAK